MRTPRRIALTLFLLTAVLLGSTGTAHAAPPARSFGRAIEALAAYQAQTTCSPTAKPGTVALRTLILGAYSGSGDYGIIRNCSVGGRSEHKEGRAWDWKVSVTNATQVRQVHDLFAWLMASDRYGNTFANARRLGIMYLIWNHKIWNASSHTWKPYSGSDPHTSHVHISLSWAGALKRTSYWTGTVSGPVSAPKPPVTTPAPAPTPTPTPKPAPVAVPLSGSATVTVPANASKGVSTPFLAEAGHRYALQVTGTYVFGAGRTADAECSVVGAEWKRHTASEDARTWTGPDGALDLQVGGQDTRWYAEDGSQCDDAHSYRMLVQPATTGQLSLRVNDLSYADNSGSLKVVVTRL